MATHDAQSGPVADDGLAATGRKDGGRFVEFSYALFDLSISLKRAFIAISVIGLGAMAITYLSAHSEHYHIAAVALVVFGSAIVAWIGAAAFMVWRVGAGATRWWAKRLKNHPQAHQ